MIAKIFVAAPANQANNGASFDDADFKAESAAFGDLQTAGAARIARAKMAMDRGFEAKQVKPGDAEYAYDKRVEYDQSGPASAWDNESDDEESEASGAHEAPSGASEAPNVAEANAPPTADYVPSWMQGPSASTTTYSSHEATEGDAEEEQNVSEASGSDLSLGEAESLPDDADEDDDEYSSDLDVDNIY